MFPDSAIASSMTCAATKATQIAKTIGQSYSVKVLEKLRCKPYTLLIDESTDSSDKVYTILLLNPPAGCRLGFVVV